MAGDYSAGSRMTAWKSCVACNIRRASACISTAAPAKPASCPKGARAAETDAVAPARDAVCRVASMTIRLVRLPISDRRPASSRPLAEEPPWIVPSALVVLAIPVPCCWVKAMHANDTAVKGRLSRLRRCLIMLS